MGRTGFFARLAWFADVPAPRRVILAIDAVGVAYGFWYYAQYSQFALTPAWLWPFVPDSPLAVLFALAALTLREFGTRKPWLDALAFVGNVQVGLWTGLVLTMHADAFGTFDGLTLNGILLVAHLGMAAHALLFVHDLRRDALSFVAAPAAWYLANDVLDYFWTGVAYHDAACPGVRPITVPCTDTDPVLAAATFGLTLVALALLVALTRPPPAPAR